MKASNKRKFQYGSAAAAFTVVFVALVIVINAIFGALANKYSWYVDMTTEQLYSISDATRELLADVDTPIKFIFCTTPDKLEAQMETSLVYELAQKYEAEYDNISIDYIDIISSPDKLDPYKSNSAYNFKTTSVIVEGPSDYRVYAIEAFYQFKESDGNLWAFKGELQMTSAILSLTYDNPIAYFTTGHGEDVTSPSAAYLQDLFTVAGYEVRTIDLSREEVDDNAKMMIINGPTYDFIGDGDSNEIEKIDAYLDNLGANLMVFMDPNTQELANLEEYLYEWGIVYEDSIVKDYSNAISVDGYSVVSNYPVEGVGASLHKHIRALDSIPKTVSRETRPITLWYDYRDSRTTSVILNTFDTAEAVSIETGESLGSGTYNLMTLTQELRYINNEQYATYVLAGGTTDFCAEEYMSGSTYGNREIIYGAMKAMGKEKVPSTIDPKLFEDNALDIEIDEANRWTIVLVTVLPGIAFLGCAVVWLRRRHL
ncbi:MAG: Gldg family protein [Clostridia bacterium]|nr:Gldg family protein [Clostridia bacterium]MBQ4574291.1 Gldg family protein [Clostridia bacterium]